ncbi:hypothetical protein VP01_2494g3 [Puccinia sorghi]|uniref:Uncharacterized protein n=1 Tax=Puccinia sorghi TaxID=27349 RepID=A0A0L6V6E3_9BASI|nr:hypothetical protein VP01_2494g3 [Puccinia sorghi]
MPMALFFQFPPPFPISSCLNTLKIQAFIKKQIFNLSLASITAGSNTHFSRCIHSFCRLLLQIHHDPSQPSTWQLTPPPSLIDLVNSIPEEMALLPLNNHLNPAISHQQPHTSIPSTYLDIFLEDLAQMNFKHPFLWPKAWKSHWNQRLAKIILKHWNTAHSPGAFFTFSLLVIRQHTLKEYLCSLQMVLWGRQQKLTKLRNQSGEKQFIISPMDLSPKQANLFEEPLFSSDTEHKTNGEIKSIQCSWRSPLFTDLAHQLDEL